MIIAASPNRLSSSPAEPSACPRQRFATVANGQQRSAGTLSRATPLTGSLVGILHGCLAHRVAYQEQLAWPAAEAAA
jgi:hypothetical protein